MTWTGGAGVISQSEGDVIGLEVEQRGKSKTAAMRNAMRI